MYSKQSCDECKISRTAARLQQFPARRDLVHGVLEDFRRWKAAAGETRALLHRNGELLEHRARLLRSNAIEFRGLVRLAHEFADRAAEQEDQEPAARSTSPRSR